MCNVTCKCSIRRPETKFTLFTAQDRKRLSADVRDSESFDDIEIFG